MKTTTLLASLALTLVTAPGVVAGGPEICEPHREVLDLSYTGFRGEQYLVIDNETEWCEFWAKAQGSKPCDPSLVDFDSEVAIVAALGNRDSTCYDVDIECIERMGSSTKVRIRVVETQRAVACPCGQAFTQPVTVVATPRPVSRTDFEKRVDRVCCKPGSPECREHKWL